MTYAGGEVGKEVKEFFQEGRVFTRRAIDYDEVEGRVNRRVVTRVEWTHYDNLTGGE